MNLIDNMVRYIIRPTRDKYHIRRLGERWFWVMSKIRGEMMGISRNDHIIKNSKGQQIHLSYYHFYQSSQYNKCVIYLHANNGSRIEGLSYLKILLENQINVCLFDFIGSGNSSGQYVTLGINQAQDLKYVIDFLIQHYKIKNIVLWGRSMGASTALFYTQKHPNNIKGIVLDSPFENLKQIIKQLASQRTGLPQFLFELIIKLVDSQIYTKTGHSIDQLKIEKYLLNNLSEIPAIFLVSKRDKLVRSYHGQELFDKYPCKDKYLRYINSQHHQNRPRYIIETIINYILGFFDCKQETNIFRCQSTRSFILENDSEKSCNSIIMKKQPSKLLLCENNHNNNNKMYHKNLRFINLTTRHHTQKVFYKYRPFQKKNKIIMINPCNNYLPQYTKIAENQQNNQSCFMTQSYQFAKANMVSEGFKMQQKGILYQSTSYKRKKVSLTEIASQKNRKQFKYWRKI